MYTAVSALICILFLVGCTATPTTQISAFGDSAKAITDKVDAVIEEYNNAALERQYTSYAALYKGVYANRFSSDELAKIEKPITAVQKKNFAIYIANQALGDYANSLSLLASAGSQTDIDLAAANLYGSMVSLNDQYKIIKKTDENLFGVDNLATASTLIAAIGSVIVENKRRKAIKKIVIQSNPKVSLICNEIAAQLKSASLESSISTSRLYVLIEHIKEYKLVAKAPSKLSWRSAEIKRLHSLQQNVFNSKLLVQKSQKAILAIKNTHEILANNLKDDKFTSSSITTAIGRLKTLGKHYNDFRSFLLTCNKISKNDKGILSCNDK